MTDSFIGADVVDEECESRLHNGFFCYFGSWLTIEADEL